MPEPSAARLDEIRALLTHLPGPDLDAGSAAATRERQLTKPAGSLGRLEELAAWLATWQGRHPPRIDHPRTVVFAANHGVAARGVSAYPASVTAQMVQNFIAGGAAVNQLCRAVDADLRVYEMNLDTPTTDIVEAPAMSEEECARAIAYGMMAVEPGIDALAVGEMGIANTTIAAALCMALFGGDAAEWTGPGTGVVGAALEQKREVVAAAVARHRPEAGDPFELLRRLGGLEFAAMAGAILAARMGRVPVVLDGVSAGAAVAGVAEGDEEDRGADPDIDEIEGEAGEEIIGAEDIPEQHRPHALEHIGRGQGPAHRLQPAGQRRHRVIDAGQRRDREDDGPGEALRAHAVTQDAAADRQAEAPAHRRQHDDKGDERQPHREDRIIVERDRQQRRRHDTDRHPDDAHREQ